MISLILSLLVHAALAAMLVVGKPLGEGVMKRLLPESGEPIIIDVIELPPGKPDALTSKKTPSFYADRSQGVEKEELPDVSAVPAARVVPAQPAAAPSHAPSAGLPAKAHPAPLTKTADTEAGAPEPWDWAVKTAPGAGAGKKAGAGEKMPGPARPNLFLTEERLAELAKKYEAEAPAGETGKTLMLNTSELRYQKYLITMKHRIEYVWEYPEVASRNAWQGTLNMDFTIKKDGTVSNVKLVKSSNYPVLDDAAMIAVRLAAPFPPFPADFAVEEITIKGQFIYDIYAPPQR